ncbi:MAG: helix-turn-helix transcriptional regulator [Myxococcota bacterium]
MGTTEKIRRLLILLPEVVRAKEGVPVSVLAEKLGVGVNELPDLIEQLMLVGKPPFSPDDLLELYVDEDRVHAVLHQALDRPPRLTHDEALALALGAKSIQLGEEEGPLGSSVLDSALSKIEEAMSEEERERYLDLTRCIALEQRAIPEPDVRAVVWKALREARRLRMTYYSAHRDELGEREVEPYGIFAHRGYWYLVAGPDGPGGHKIYRLDRIREARPSSDPNVVCIPEAFDMDLVSSGRFGRWSGDAVARIRIEGSKSRFARERFSEDQINPGPGGSVEVSFEGASHDWVSSLVISVAGEAEVIDPPSLAQKVLEDARRTRALYD